MVRLYEITRRKIYILLQPLYFERGRIIILTQIMRPTMFNLLSSLSVLLAVLPSLIIESFSSQNISKKAI